jgi:hypothetical protein
VAGASAWTKRCASGAIGLISIANNHLLSAWKHMVGRPMPGVHRVFDQALADLRLLRERIGEATQLIQSNESGIE